MALIGILFVIFTATCVGAQGVFATVDCNVSFGKHGQQSLLQCVVKPNVNVTDMEIEMVAWKKETRERDKDKPLLTFSVGETPLRKDYMLAEPSLNSTNMNVSLLITNTMVEHAGVYRCTVRTNYGYIENTTNLTVTAKYSETTVSSVLGKITQNTDGHQKGAASREEEKSHSTSKIVAPVVVIGLLIIGLLMLPFYLRRRKNGPLTNNASEEEEEGEEGEEKGLRNKDDDGELV